MKNKNPETIDAILEKFSHEYQPGAQRKDGSFHENTKPLTIWIDVDMRKKYELLQNSSGRNFGKILRSVIEKSIEKIPLDVVDLDDAS